MVLSVDSTIFLVFCVFSSVSIAMNMSDLFRVFAVMRREIRVNKIHKWRLADFGILISSN